MKQALVCWIGVREHHQLFHMLWVKGLEHVLRHVIGLVVLIGVAQVLQKARTCLRAGGHFPCRKRSTLFEGVHIVTLLADDTPQLSHRVLTTPAQCPRLYLLATKWDEQEKWPCWPRPLAGCGRVGNIPPVRKGLERC